MSRNSSRSSDIPVRENFLSALAKLLSSQKMQMNLVLDIVEFINSSMNIAKEAIIVLEDIFLNEKSDKILFTVEVFQSFVKNCNKNFHIAANRDSFMQSLLRLVRRQLGKFTIVEKLRSNMDNWSRIEAKVLYILQLWYDAFMMEENQYSHIINTYKLLRKEGVLFPPRQQNEKNMLAIKTSSPIFDNLAEISQQDQRRFEKKKLALGLTQNSKVVAEMQQLSNPQSRLSKSSNVPSSSSSNPKSTLPPVLDLTETQQLIAIIRSLDYLTAETNQSYEKLKSLVENHRKPKFLGLENEQVYKQVLQEAENVIREWQGKFKDNVISQEEEYMRRVMSGMGSKSPSKGSDGKQSPRKQPQSPPKEISQEKPKNQTEQIDLLDLEPIPPKKQLSVELPKQPPKQLDLLDL